jgi:hypothetical protein
MKSLTIPHRNFQYAELLLSKNIKMRLAVFQTIDGEEIEINRDELEWFRNLDTQITMPASV